MAVVDAREFAAHAFDLHVLLGAQRGDADGHRVGFHLAELGLAELPLGEVLGRFLSRLLVKALGTVKGGDHLPGLLLLVSALAGVPVHQVGPFPQRGPLRGGLVVGLVLDRLLLARVHAHGLGLDARSLGPL